MMSILTDSDIQDIVFLREEISKLEMNDKACLVLLFLANYAEEYVKCWHDFFQNELESKMEKAEPVGERLVTVLKMALELCIEQNKVASSETVGKFFRPSASEFAKIIDDFKRHSESMNSLLKCGISSEKSAELQLIHSIERKVELDCSHLNNTIEKAFKDLEQERKKDLEKPNEFGFPPLHQACSNGNVELVQALLKCGADVHALAGDRKSTPLHIAAEYNNVNVVDMLLQNGAASDLLKGDHEGDTPLHIATGNYEILKLMFKKMLKEFPHNSVNDILNGNKQNLLHYAAGKGNGGAVDFLIEMNVDKFARDYKGATPFHFGARKGIVPVMKMLMGEDVNVENYDGLTALHYAARNGHNRVVEWLLQMEALVSIADMGKGNNALHWAAIEGSSEVIYTLLISTANADHHDVWATNFDDKLPIDLAYEFKHAPAVKAIWEAMRSSLVFERMARSTNAPTSLHYAAAYGTQTDVAKVLEQILDNTPRDRHGKSKNFIININRRDKHGQTAFHWAASKGNTEVIEVIGKSGVDPLTKDGQGRSPLCLALIENQLEFAKELFKFLGDKQTDDEWIALVQRWTNTFCEKINKDDELIDKFREHMKGTHSDGEIVNEMPVVYQALYVGNGKEDIAKFIQQSSRGREAFEFVNSKGRKTNRTALHWATILKQREIVSILCNTEEFSKDLIGNVVDIHGKTPLDYATESDILKELLTRKDVQSQVDDLYKDRQVYVELCNAILVGAALIASFTYEGHIKSPNDQVLSSVSFFSSIATVAAAAYAMLPVRDCDIVKSVTNIRKTLIYAGSLLAISLALVLSTSIAAGFAHWPGSFKHPKLILSNMVPIFFTTKFIFQLFRDQPKSTKHIAAQSTWQRHDSDNDDDGNSVGLAYKLGNRHEYIAWDDGLDNLEKKRERIRLQSNRTGY